MGADFKLNKLDWFALLSPFIGAIASIGFYYHSGGGVGFYGALLITTLVYLTTEKLARLSAENARLKDDAAVRDITLTAERNIKEILLQSRQKDLVYLATVSEGIAWFADHCRDLVLVKNTVFCRSLPGKPDIPTAERNMLEASIKAALNSGDCKWYDIASQSQEPAIKSFYECLDAKQKQVYFARKLKTTVPIIQCMVLVYRDGRQSVLFGWNFESLHCKSNLVFQGADTGSFFSNYMDALAADDVSDPIIFSPSSPAPVAPQPPPPQPPPATPQATAPPGR